MSDDRQNGNRRGSVAGAGDDLQAIVSRAMEGCPPLDDAEAWAKRDAEVAVQIAKQQAERERRRLDARAKILLAAGFPRRAMDLAIEPRDTQPVVAMRTWAIQRRNVLVLGGPVGIGKTVAASSYALRADFLTWNFVRAQTFAATSRYDREEMGRLTQGALVLDDLGSEFSDKMKSFMVDLEELVDTFYASKRPLIITTNIAAEDMPKRYKSERLITRLRESARWIELGDAPSLRPPPKSVSR